MQVHTSLQAMDTATTLYIVNNGGREVNPLMQPIVTNPAVFIALKMAIMTVASKLPEDDLRTLNYIYGGVVLNNLYQICR